mmetsp:Transcript_27997/g.83424  ORF Transcript_27997/g.83424 Transcript_27997/m.83424 type:complete len:212 (-) Transcript_27997:1113-1748(-)
MTTTWFSLRKLAKSVGSSSIISTMSPSGLSAYVLQTVSADARDILPGLSTGLSEMRAPFFSPRAPQPGYVFTSVVKLVLNRSIASFCVFWPSSAMNRSRCRLRCARGACCITFASFMLLPESSIASWLEQLEVLRPWSDTPPAMRPRLLSSLTPLKSVGPEFVALIRSIRSSRDTTCFEGEALLGVLSSEEMWSWEQFSRGAVVGVPSSPL